MCGIAVEIGSSASSVRVARMVSTMSHRGPDATGVRDIDLMGAVGMCRLRIRGPYCGLPVQIAGGTSTIAYNGEIYAHSSDQQCAVPATLQEEAEAFYQAMRGKLRLDGMYVAADFDQRARQVFVARDEFGIKPLYRAMVEKSVQFASEIRALLAVADSWSVRSEAVHDFLLVGRVVGQQTFFAGIESLSPGMKVRFAVDEGNGAVTSTHARMHRLSGDAADLTEALERSVRACTISDVPIALAVSGGVDSSLLADILSRQGREELTTFSVTTGAPGGDDHCASLAELCLGGHAWKKWRHEIVRVSPADYLADLKNYIRHTGKPTRMSSAPLYFALGRAVAAHGIKVLLCGEGADELLFGYNSYQHFAQSACDEESWLSRVEQYYLPQERLALLELLLEREALVGAIARLRADLGSIEETSMSAAVRAAERGYRLEPLLERTDNALMAHSVEGRVPYLHGDVPRHAEKFSLSECLSGDATKIPLRAIAPPGLASRNRRKMNFRAPVTTSLGVHILADFARLRAPFESAFAQLGIRQSGVDRILEEARRKPSSAAVELLFSLYTLSLWLESIGGTQSPRPCHRQTSGGTAHELS